MSKIRLAATCATLSLLALTPAGAQEDGALFRGLLSGLGIVEGERPVIDYRQRAPLVLPPNSNLPAPAQPAAARNPNWPNDPDAARARAAAAAAGAPIVRTDPGRTLTNGEMRAQQPGGGLFGGGPIDTTRTPTNNAALGRSLTADEMRVRPIWTEVGALVGGITGARNDANERLEFRGEPTRTRLVEPPPGFRTPSADAAFGPVGRRPDDPNSPAARSSAESRSRQDPGAGVPTTR